MNCVTSGKQHIAMCDSCRVLRERSPPQALPHGHSAELTPGGVQGRQVNRNTDLRALMFTCENVLGTGTALNVGDEKIV